MSKNDEDKEEDLHMEKITDDNIKGHKYLFRICLIGNASVGKTSLLKTYTSNPFQNKYMPTVGVDFQVVTLKYKEIIAKVHIWDTAGEERFKSISSNYYRSSHGFIYVYDITDADSLNSLENWITLTNEHTNSNVINFLVGNKIDLENDRKVSTNQGKEFASKHNLIFLETSAKTNENVQRLFEYFTFKLINYFEINKSKYMRDDDDNDDQDMTSFSNLKPLELENDEKSKCGC